MTHCISQTSASHMYMGVEPPTVSWQTYQKKTDYPQVMLLIFFVFICVSFKTNIYPVSNQIMFCVICYLDVRILFIQNSSFNTFWHLTSDTYLS